MSTTVDASEWRWSADPRAERAAERAWHKAFERGASDTQCAKEAREAMAAANEPRIV